MLLALGVALLGPASARAQAPLLDRLTVGLKLTSQAYGLPFRNVGQGRRNLGVAAELSYAYNSRQTLLQTLQLGVQHHREHGNQYSVNTQLAYRPTLLGRLEPGVALGLGRVYSFANPRNPVYEQDGSGTWRKSARQHRGHWQAPLSLSLGYRVQRSEGMQVTPFVDYQITPIINYNEAFVAFPYSLLSVGMRVKLPQS